MNYNSFLQIFYVLLYCTLMQPYLWQVKDDPELLKRTIKRKEQHKKQSTKKWDSRIEHVRKSKQEKQDKRQENITKRKKEKKLTKLKKAAKKGRVIPGF